MSWRFSTLLYSWCFNNFSSGSGLLINFLVNFYIYYEVKVKFIPFACSIQYSRHKRFWKHFSFPHLVILIKNQLTTYVSAAFFIPSTYICHLYLFSCHLIVALLKVPVRTCESMFVILFQDCFDYLEFWNFIKFERLQAFPFLWKKDVEVLEERALNLQDLISIALPIHRHRISFNLLGS